MLKIALSLFIYISLALTHSLAWADFEQDLSAAGNINAQLRELRIMAVAGNADAQLSLGGVFFKGKEVDQDYAEAAKWFRLAARQGLPQAQFNLGMMYDTGTGVILNHTEAVEWYRLAAQQGLALAQLNLGVAYASGSGVEKNESEAAKWMKLAAEQGESQAQFNMGVMYANGQGVTQSYTEAYRWAKLAASQGHEVGKALMRDLSVRITNEQQTEKRLETMPELPAKLSEKNEYYLQLAAFKSQAEAEKYLVKMRSQLDKIDYPFSIFTSDGWIRTQLGPYTSLEEARKNAKSLKSSLGYEPLLKLH